MRKREVIECRKVIEDGEVDVITKTADSTKLL